MTESEIKSYRALPPASRYLTMVLTAMGANLPDGWTHVSLPKLAAEVRIHEMTVRPQLDKLAASGLFEVRTILRDGRMRVDVKPTFLHPVEQLQVTAQA